MGRRRTENVLYMRGLRRMSKRTGEEELRLRRSEEKED